MSAMVFKIQQSNPNSIGKEQQISEGTLGETQTLPAGALANAEKPDVENVSSGAAAPAVDGVAVSSTEVKTPEEPAEVPTKDMMVKVDGPVGRLFTTALNKILATEGYMTVPPEALNVPGVLSSGAQEIQDPMFEVFCWRTDAVNTEEIVQLTNMITKHKDRTFVVALESAGKLSKSMGILEELGKIDNVKICYSLESAANHVAGKLRG